MSELTFIGLANYVFDTTNFVAIIFTSENNSQTSYMYQFSTLNTPNNNWVPISSLTNVSIIANTEINIQLIIPSTILMEGNYYIFIKSTITNTIIWQLSNSYFSQGSLSTLIGTLPSTSSQVSLSPLNATTSSTLFGPTVSPPVGNNISTADGGYILNNIITNNITLDNWITISNVLLTVPSITFNPSYNPSDNTSNIQNAPLFIIGCAGIVITDDLTTMAGSINIIGININGSGISIPNAININGNCTFNGVGISGIVLTNTITCNDNTVFNGITSNSDSFDGVGIVILNNIINNGQYQIILNGGTTLNNTKGTDFYNKPGNILPATVTLYPNYSTNNGVSSSFIPYIIPTTSSISIAIKKTKKIQTWQIVLIVILVLLLVLGIILITTRVI